MEEIGLSEKGISILKGKILKTTFQLSRSFCIGFATPNRWHKLEPVKCMGPRLVVLLDAINSRYFIMTVDYNITVVKLVRSKLRIKQITLYLQVYDMPCVLCSITFSAGQLAHYKIIMDELSNQHCSRITVFFTIKSKFFLGTEKFGFCHYILLGETYL